MEFKKIQLIQSHIIEDVDGSLYRRNFEDGWEQLYEATEEWHPVYYTKELERDFQEYLKSKDNEPMTCIKPLPDSMTAPWNGTPITDHTFAGIPNQPTELKSAYIPTTFIVPPELKVGDKWFVKLQGASCLTEQKIIEVTEKTVILQRMDDSLAGHAHLRYKKTDIEFVEKVQ
jgi:hypothetical protein